MFNFILEQSYFDQGYHLLGALDEAGRGPLAGPVVAGCVVISRDNLKNLQENKYILVNDSKKLSKKKREKAYQFIVENFAYSIGICDHQTIDRINILEATFLAMKKALGALKQKPNFVLVDGKLPIPNFSTPQRAIINGDAKVFLIAAASIVAKVTRDRLMNELHLQYPVYGFNKHAGYGTKIHLENLKKYGPCFIHRKSFAPIKKLLD